MDSSSSMQSGQGTYQRGTFREITPAAGPRVAHGADVFITANFIWWKAQQDGLRYASSGVNTTTTAADPFASASTGKNKFVGSDWDPGFKVGLGLNLSHDGWDLFAQYTWLHSSDSNSISSNDAVVSNFAANSGQINGNPTLMFGTRATGKWDLHFNVIDVELGRNFYLSQFLTMRPFIGFKGTWQDQDTRFNYESTGFNIDGVPTPATGPYRIHNHVDTWGIGVRGGLNLAYYMAKSWSIYGNLAWTSMWADYDDLKRTDTLDDATTGNSSRRINISNDSYYTIKYVAETEIGLRWEIWFYDDNYHFAIQAGWEQQVW
ncbi:MAG: autotransporter outer membrane beta-barrel domain-containing protein, partial [Chlamydiia bacterium]|nr:autotransporter outer membrane beta-barrel domain-containing protein [Chlamydiia bacterium]